MAGIEPPKWADRLVEMFCPTEYLEEVQGDLHEAFYLRAEDKSIGHAKRRFIFEAFRTIQLFRIKSSDIMKNFYLSSLKSYFKTGFRFLWKTRVYSSINIFGLAIGMASATLAFLFLSDQLSFDQFHKNADQLYRITASMVWEGETEKLGGASYIMGSALPDEVPGIVKASHIKIGLALRPIGEDYDYQRFHYADGSLFSMLDFEFLRGDPGKFEDLNGVVISESFAESLDQTDELTLNFGSEDQVFSIIGVFKDLPNNSTLRPELILPMNLWVNTVEKRRTLTWFDINMNVFVQTRKDVKQEDVEREMNKVFAANFDVEKNDAQIHLQPFAEMHTDTSLRLGNGLNANANWQILRVVSIIGILCLLISCFNYSNFATGNFLSRAKEVAVRKIMGANKTSIIKQFITESFISTFLAGALGVLLIIMILPFFSDFVGEEYTLDMLWTKRFLLGLLSVLSLSTFLAGIYPSLILASQKANSGLKQKLKVGGKSIFGWFLVMLQVSLTIFLIIGMFTVGRQLNHLVDFNLGYEDDNILQLALRGADDQSVAQLERELKQLPFVQEVAANSGYNGTDFEMDGKRIETRHLRIDDDFIPSLNMEIVEGRNFDPAQTTDKQSAIIINETLQKMIGKGSLVDQILPFDYGELKKPRVIGVVKDFHFDSPKSTIEPLVIYTSPEYPLQELLIKLNPGSTNQELKKIEASWRKVYPLSPIIYGWLEDTNAARMETEAQIQRLSQAGSLIAILLASLGLFGMVGTHVRQRLKEVSIRKVNGASPQHIYWLFSKKFGGWLAMGFLVGSIPAVLILNNWLADYPERIQLGIGTPLLSTFICTIIFLLIITMLLYKVIYVNPVVYLKDE